MRFFLLAVLATVGCSDDSTQEAPKVVLTDQDADAGTDVERQPEEPVLLACDTDAACELTCEVLSDPTFCWNVARDQANACGSGSQVGDMSADGLVCTVGDVVVTLEQPLAQGDALGNQNWNFAIDRAGSRCASLQDTDDSLTLTTKIGAVQTTYGADLYRVQCDAGSWESSDPEGLLGCKDANGLTSLPGTTTTQFGNEFQFGFLPGPDNLFACRFAQ